MITSIPNFLISYLPRKLYVLKILVHPFFFSNHKGEGIFLHLAIPSRRKTTWLIATIPSCGFQRWQRNYAGGVTHTTGEKTG